MSIQINLQGFTEYLSEKRFGFLLERVNAEEIEPRKSEKIYNALQNKAWNQIK